MRRTGLLLISMMGLFLLTAADPAPLWKQSSLVAAADPVEPAKLSAPKATDQSGTGLVPLPKSAPAEKLKSSTEELRKELTQTPSADTSSMSERQLLRMQMMELLKKLGEKKSDSIPAQPVTPKPEKTIPGTPSSGEKTPSKPIDMSGNGKPSDVIRVAQNLYRSGDTTAAYQMFKGLDVSALPKDDRAFVQYMMACCLRKKNQLNEAAALYREVLDSRDDEFLAESAQWQIGQIRSIQELQAQLEQLRLRKK